MEKTPSTGSCSKESTGLVKEIQKVLLDDADFLRSLVKENLQKILNAEFEAYLSQNPADKLSPIKVQKIGEVIAMVVTVVDSRRE